MKTLVATTALALVLAGATHTPAAAQTAEQPADQDQAQAQPDAAPEAELDDETGIGGAPGIATGAIGETFFIRAPQEFHLLASGMEGHPVFFDTTPTGMAGTIVEEPEAAGTVDEAIRAGEEPLGTVVDVVLDRRGGAAGLVLQLSDDLRGGAREVTVAMGLVRMLPDTEDPSTTHILLSLDPVDIENAPTFERPGAAADEAGAAPQDAAPLEDQAEGEAEQQPQQAEGAEQEGAQQPEQAEGAPEGGQQQPEVQQ